MSKLLCPSMMCADCGNLATETQLLDTAGADLFHIDIMDGNFVPNFGMGPQDIQGVVGNTKKPVDVHLMINDPGRYVEMFATLGADIIYIHPEADVHAPRTLDTIARSGAKPGIALNPGTTLDTVRPLLSLVDYILVMTVNPGFAGQTYLPFVDEKIDELLEEKKKYDFQIVIDGACSPAVIARLSAKGVDGFVLGTSALFGKEKPYGEIIEELRAL